MEIKKIDEIKSLSLKDLSKLQKEVMSEFTELNSKAESLFKYLNDINTLILEKDNRYVKIKCVNCNGEGTIKKDGKLTLCDICGGKKYIWGELYEE